MLARQLVHQSAVQLLAAVGHREEAEDLRPFAASTSCSCSSVRDESVAGMIGTSSASAASNTLSETSEMLGGQSRNVYS